MRKTALLLVAAVVLTGCSQSASPSKSNSVSVSVSKSTKRTFGTHHTSSASATPSTTPQPSSTSSKLAQSITDARNHLVVAAKSQVTCEKGSTLYVGPQAQMQAPDLDELFLVAMVACDTNGVRGPSVPEVFHWRDNDWTSVATIRIKNYVVDPIGKFAKINENKLRLSVHATPTKGGATATKTLEVRREALSYWAEIVAN